MNTTHNQRYRQTEERIIYAFITLLQEKALEKITVADICRTCGINRASFYLHFADIPDMMETVEANLARYFGEVFCDTDARPKLEQRFQWLFSFILQNKMFYRVYFAEHHRLRLLDVVIPEQAEQIKRQIASKAGFTGENDLRYHEAFFKAGVTALTREWLMLDCPESPERLATILLEEYTIPRQLP